MDDEQIDDGQNADQTQIGAGPFAYPYGDLATNIRCQALQIAHNTDLPIEDVVARARAYADFIRG
jgi:hypothetical protein